MSALFERQFPWPRRRRLGDANQLHNNTTMEFGYGDSGETGSASGKESQSLASFTYEDEGSGNSAEGTVRSKQKSSTSSAGGASVSTYSNETISTMDFQFESAESSGGGNSSHIKGKGNQQSESRDGGGTRTDAEGHTTTWGSYKTEDYSTVSFVFSSSSNSGSAGQSQSSGIGAKGTMLSSAESGGSFMEVDGVRTGSGSYLTAESSSINFDFFSTSKTSNVSSTTTQLSSTTISAKGISSSSSGEEGTYTESAAGTVKTGGSGHGSSSKVEFTFDTETSSRSTASGFLATNYTRMGAKGSSLTSTGASVDFGGSETFTSVSNSTVDFDYTSTANTGTATGGTNTTISAKGKNLTSSAEGGTNGVVEFTEIATSDMEFTFNSVTTSSSIGGGLTSNTQTRIGAGGTTSSSSSDEGTRAGDSRDGTMASNSDSNVTFSYSSINNRLLEDGYSSSSMTADGTTGSSSSMSEDYQEDGQNRHANGSSQSASSNVMYFSFTSGTSNWGSGTSSSTMSVAGVMTTSSQGAETYSESPTGRSSFGSYAALASNSFNYDSSSSSTEGENSQSNSVSGFMSMSFSDGGSFTSAPGPYAEPTVTTSGASAFNMSNTSSYNNSQSTTTIDGNTVTVDQQNSSGSNNSRFYDSSSYSDGYTTGDSGNSTSGTFSSRNQTTATTTEWMMGEPMVTMTSTTTTSTGSTSSTQTSSYSPEGAVGTYTNSSSSSGTWVTVTNPGGTSQGSSGNSSFTSGTYNSRVTPSLPGGGGPSSFNFNLGGLPSLSGGGGGGGPGGGGAGRGQMTAAEWEAYYRQNTPGLADNPQAGGGMSPDAIDGVMTSPGIPGVNEALIWDKAAAGRPGMGVFAQIRRPANPDAIIGSINSSGVVGPFVPAPPGRHRGLMLKRRTTIDGGPIPEPAPLTAGSGPNALTGETIKDAAKRVPGEVKKGAIQVGTDVVVSGAPLIFVPAGKGVTSGGKLLDAVIEVTENSELLKRMIEVAGQAAKAGKKVADVGPGVSVVATAASSAARRAPAADNYRGRFNAKRHAEGKSRLPDDYDAHHRIPQEYMDHPEFNDFDFHDPSNIQGVKGSRSDVNTHQLITNEWAEFRRRNPNATRAEIEAFAEEIDKRYADHWLQ